MGSVSPDSGTRLSQNRIRCQHPKLRLLAVHLHVSQQPRCWTWSAQGRLPCAQVPRPREWVPLTRWRYQHDLVRLDRVRIKKPFTSHVQHALTPRMLDPVDAPATIVAKSGESTTESKASGRRQFTRLYPFFLAPWRAGHWAPPPVHSTMEHLHFLEMRDGRGGARASRMKSCISRGGPDGPRINCPRARPSACASRYRGRRLYLSLGSPVHSVLQPRTTFCLC